MTPITVKAYTNIEVDRRELLRYAGVRGDSPESSALAESVIAEASPLITLRLAYREIKISELPLVGLDHPAILDRLAGCSSVILLAATSGIALDRLILRAGTTSPARALMLDALGAERVEAVIDRFTSDLLASDRAVGVLPRFSPGYGRIPLEIQKIIFSLLDCPRTVGITLGDSLLMSPAKSVTAFIGIKER